MALKVIVTFASEGDTMIDGELGECGLRFIGTGLELRSALAGDSEQVGRAL